jgi:heavy metal sensor kinase
VKARQIFGTLHFRLTVWNTVVMLLLLVATLFGVREVLLEALLRETDELLTEDAAEMDLTIKELYPDFDRIHRELERKSTTHPHRGLFVQLLDPDGTVRWQSGSTPDASVVPVKQLKKTGVFDVGEYRLAHRQVNYPGIPRFTIRVGDSLKTVADIIDRFTEFLVLFGAGILFISPLGGYWLAGRATRPLAKIIDTTSRLHPTNLDERLPLRGTRDELDQLSATINGFLDRIAAYLEQNREFTANAAHELRSPLAAIQSSMDVALNADRSIDEYKDLIGETLEECGRLRDLVNQLLLLAESDAGRMEIGSETVPLDHIVEKSSEMFAGVAEAAGVELSLGQIENVPVYGNASRLRQVINNLIDNAIKFTPSPGKITVDLRYNRITREVLLQVSDTGMGIASEDLPHVLERFYRGDKSRQRRKAGGTGLGLSICDAIVKAHGGRIDVYSTVGKGTTVVVAFPPAEHLSPSDSGIHKDSVLST